MKPVRLLIDMAREKAHGNDALLARAVGMQRQDWHEIAKGKRPLSPEVAATLCDYLGLPGDEAREFVAAAVIENPKNASKRSLLERALFALWLLGVGSLALGTTTDASAALAAHSDRVGVYTYGTYGIYIVVGRRLTRAGRLLRTLAAWVRALLAPAPRRSVPALAAASV